jgi:CRP/FNR family transcriptional regulator
MTRTDIADFLGLTIETVSRTFTKLRMLRLIELPQASRVRLVDIDRLRSMEGSEAEA